MRKKSFIILLEMKNSIEKSDMKSSLLLRGNNKIYDGGKYTLQQRLFIHMQCTGEDSRVNIPTSFVLSGEFRLNMKSTKVHSSLKPYSHLWE